MTIIHINQKNPLAILYRKNVSVMLIYDAEQARGRIIDEVMWCREPTIEERDIVSHGLVNNKIIT